MSALDKKIDIVISREKEKPRTIEETIELYRIETHKLTSWWNYIKTWSWLLVNVQNNACKWHCMHDKWIPIVCGKLEYCNNFTHAASILVEIDFYEFKKAIDDIY